MNVKILNSNLDIVEEMKTGLSEEIISVPTVHQVVKAALASRRQGNASTKGRSDVRGGGKKPFKQKGTGRARQGSSRSPVMVGGGTVFGPQPRDFVQKINKKTKKKAIMSVIADKIANEKLFVFEELPAISKTKEAVALLDKLKIKNVLIVANNKEDAFFKATRNIKTCKSVAMTGISVYEAVKKEYLILTKSNFNSLMNEEV